MKFTQTDTAGQPQQGTADTPVSQEPLPAGYSDPSNWIPVPDDEPAPRGWTWERLAGLQKVILHAAGERTPQTDLERWLWRTVRRLARREARRLLRRELPEAVRLLVR